MDINMMTNKVFISGLIFILFLFILPTSIKAETLCSYAGPDLSEDLFRLTNFIVTGPSPIKEGDTVTVKFKLQNYGQYDRNLGTKGIFVAARDPDNLDASFGFSHAGTISKVGQIISIETTKVVNTAGTWKIWPSYHISNKEEKFGSNEWHVCKLTVTAVIKDSDKDGITDEKDNCPQVHNLDQKNGDGDAFGDVCDDSDQDGVTDDKDNCIFVPNPKQEDSNKNGIGDACERIVDSDKDGISDEKDNCPKSYNPKQGDIDQDKIGDACDVCDDRDSDGDKIKNCLDVCPEEKEIFNNYKDDDGCPDEKPTEVKDSDKDGISDDKDNCPNK